MNEYRTYGCWGRLDVRYELAVIADGPGPLGGVFSLMRRCEEAGGGAEVVL